MTKYYISGPMTGQPGHNYELFNEVEADMKASALKGDKIVNPARNFGGDRTRKRSEYMLADIALVLAADVIVLLPGWEASEGAKLEVKVAAATDKEFRAAQWGAGGWTYPPVSYAAVIGVQAGDDGAVRTFGTGATRDTEVGKLDFEGFLSPAVLDEFARYMDRHRTRSNGTLRDSDDWQKGIPRNAYMKSMWRHFMDVWRAHRGLASEQDRMESLMGLLFNVQGYAYELLREAA